MASIVVPPRDYRLAPLRGALPEVQLQMMSDQQLRLSLTDENGLASEVSDATTRNSGKVTIQFAEHPERAPGVTLQAFRGQSLDVDLARGIVTPEEIPPPSPSSPHPDDIQLHAGRLGRKRRCAEFKMLQHTRILLRKNFTLAQRHPRQTSMQLFVHALFVLFLFWLQGMGKTRLMAEELHPPIIGLGKVPKCVEFAGQPCKTIMYSPAGHPEVDWIMNELARTSDLVMGSDIVAAPAHTNWSSFFLEHPNSTQAAVAFLDRELDGASDDWHRTCPRDVLATARPELCSLPDIVRYRIYWNETTQYSRTHRTYTPYFPMDFTREIQRELDQAILTLRGRQAGVKRCFRKTIEVGATAAGEVVKTFTVAHTDATLANLRLRCSDASCAYESHSYERRPAPTAAISTAHLDPTGRGPHDWYLTRRTVQIGQNGADRSEQFTVGRYDHVTPVGWSTALAIEYDECHDGWTADLNVTTKSFPVVGDEKVENLLSEAVFLGFGVLFFYCGAVFNYFLLLLKMVREKQHKLRSAMLSMGLSRGSLWLSWLLHSIIINACAGFLCCCAGFVCGFQYFYSSNPFIIFGLFWLFSLAMTSFSFFASSLINTERTAVAVGFLLLVVGSFFQVIVGAGTVYFYDDAISPLYRRVLFHYPPFNFAKVFVDIGLKIGAQTFEGVREGDRLYYSWEHLGEGEFPTGANMFYLMMNFFEYFLLAWYCDFCVSFDAGQPQPWYFPLVPSFWCRRPGAEGAYCCCELAPAAGPFVGMEMNPVVVSGSVPALRVRQLGKTFHTGCCGRNKCSNMGAVHALKDCTFDIDNNHVFCLLGPNGAGKTTLLSILTGVHPPSSGEAHVCGMSIEHDMNMIRKHIGVCQQHDVLWPDLTAREHLEMFSAIKGATSTIIAVQVPQVLLQMKLQNDADIPVGKFSGGMKRRQQPMPKLRLSIGISMIGDPKVIFLDEPTTGADPGNRQKIWGLIQEIKRDKLIILTTHSMDECEVVSDRVGIMLQGSLFRPDADHSASAISNTATALKNKYGVGYRLMVESNPGREAELVPLVRSLMPTAANGSPVMIDDRPGAARTFLVPKERSGEIQALLRHFEDEDRAVAVAKQWSITHATLSEAFMSIVRSNRAQSAVATGSTGFESAAVQRSAADLRMEANGFISIDAVDRARDGTSAAAFGGLIDFDEPLGNDDHVHDSLDGPEAVGGGRVQMLALVKKNYAWQKRQKCVVCCQILVPALLLVVVVLIQLVVDSTFVAKADWKIALHKPKEIDIENLIPAMLYELELDTSAAFLSANRQYCYQAEAGTQIDLYCPRGGVISTIEFASFGTPKGNCGSLRYDPDCHVDVGRIVAALCGGINHCTFFPSSLMFGGIPSVDCPTLILQVQIKCGRVVNDTTRIGDVLNEGDGLRAAVDLIVENSDTGAELEALVGGGVQDLALVLLDSFDERFQTGQDDFGEFNVGDVLRNELGVDTSELIGDALAKRFRETNTSIQINLAEVLGRPDLRFTLRELVNISRFESGTTLGSVLGITQAQMLQLELAGINPSTPARLAFDTAGLSSTQVALLATMGLATDITTVSPLTALEDTPIDVGAALGLGGATNTDLELTNDQLAALFEDRNITIGDVLGLINITQVDFTLDVVRGSRPSFVLEINTEQTRNQLNISKEVYSVIPVLFGGTSGGLSGDDLLEQVQSPEEIERLIEDSVESVIVNYYRLTNTPPLTPPVMMWSTPRLFHVLNGNTLRDADGWLNQIDREVRESKLRMFRKLNALKFNSRMQVAEFLPLAADYFKELPFASLIFSDKNSIAEGYFSYTVQVETEQVYMSWWLPVQLFYKVLLNFVDSSIGWAIDGRTRIDVELQAMDHEYNAVSKPAISETLSYILFPFALSFLLPVFMSMIVFEKEEKLRELCKMSGMKMKYYWVANYCCNYLLYLVVVAVFTFVALLVGIRLWTQTSPVVLFTLLFLWGHAMVSLAFLLSTFFSHHLTSSLAGYLIVVGGVLASLVFNNTIYYRTPPPFFYMMYAPLAFYRAIYIMTDSCRRYKCVEMDSLVLHNPVDTDANATDADADANATIISVCFYLVLDTLMYWALFLYFDKISPSEVGVRDHPLFFLKPLARWWNRRQAERLKAVDGEPVVDAAFDGAQAVRRREANTAGLRRRRSIGVGVGGVGVGVDRIVEHQTVDGVAEKERVLTSTDRGEYAVVTDGLRHVYDKGLRAKSGREALDELFLTIRHGECLALLGHNGAGKTTLISILTGLFQPTKGTARIFGLDIKENMAEIHQKIGIVPQFSILWDTLTCREHLLFFARLKGVPDSLQHRVVESTLAQVGLHGLPSERLARELSGGMRRRLSIAMALVGNPMFLVMDEPTTGLDPETRLELWRTLLALKHDKAILLATHAMDEAELLGDQIAILSAGELKCKGSSIQLKQRYCPDMLLRVNFCPGQGKQAILAAIPQAILQPGSEFEGTAEFALKLPAPGTTPAAGEVLLSEVFGTMERLAQDRRTERISRGKVVLHWAVTQMDLETVFLKLCPTSEDDLAPRRRQT